MKKAKNEERKVALEEFDVCRRALPMAFRPLGELFTQLTGVRPGALLCLDPHLWEIRFFGVDSQQKSTKESDLGKELATAIRKQEKKRKKERKRRGLMGHQDLFELIRDLLQEETKKTGDELRAYNNLYEGAINLLETRPVRPGNGYWRPESNSLVQVKHWQLAEEAKPLTRFQDVLDFASYFKFDYARMSDERGEGEDYQPSPEENPILLIVRNYAEREGLIQGQNTLIFVAEHIQTLGRDAKIALEILQGVTHIDSYFMPLRGLGQWRAAFDCKCLGGGSDGIAAPKEKITSLKQQASQLARGGFEDLLTSALINAFALALHDTQRPEELYGLFATLWWSRHIKFYRQSQPESGDLVARVCWCSKSLKLVLDEIPDSESRLALEEKTKPGVVEEYGRSHRGWLRILRCEEQHTCEVTLDLRQLYEDRTQKQILLERWNFDRVEYLCELMDPGAAEDFHRWADSLGDQLVAVRRSLAEGIKRTAAEQAERALFAFGHHLGNLFLESGLVAFDPNSDVHQSEKARRFEQIRARLMLAWGLGEAIRPMRYGGRGYPRRWFPAEQRIADPVDLSSKLQDIIRLYLSGICSELNPSWRVTWNLPGAIREVETLGEILLKSPSLPSLPPFNGEEAGTLAVTLGLAEQLRNIRHNWSSNSRELQRGVDKGYIDNMAEICIEIDSREELCQVVCRPYNFYRRQRSVDPEESFFSTSIGEIRNLEAKALAIASLPVAETSQPLLLDRTDIRNEKGRYVRTQSTWIYHYGRVVPITDGKNPTPVCSGM